jgi:hypothetical protein
MSFVDDGFIIQFMGAMIGQMPLLAVYGLGILLAILWWGRHPKVSMLTCLAFGLMLVTSVTMTAVTVWLPIYMREKSAISMQDLRTTYIFVGLARSALHAGGLGLLLWAIYADRGGPTEFLSSVR